MLSPTTYQSLPEDFPADWPDIEYPILDAYFGTGTDSIVAAGSGEQYVAASVGIFATFSRSNVTIKSKDTATNPIFGPKWLSDPRDQDIAIAAFRRGRQLFSTNAIRLIIRAEAFSGINVITDSLILNTIKAGAKPVYNAAGTNQMGKIDDLMDVADSKGRIN